MYFKVAIEDSPLQVYTSGLLFSPAESLVKGLFKHEESTWIKIRPPIKGTWNACLQTLEGHGGSVSSVAFLPDSGRLASGSGDRAVKIWDPHSGVCLQTFQVGRAPSLLAFDKGSSTLRTEHDMLKIEGFPSSYTTSASSDTQGLSCPLVGITSDLVWLTRDSTRTLWIPSDFRPSCTAISSTTIGLGVASGKVWVYSFDVA